MQLFLELAVRITRRREGAAQLRANASEPIVCEKQFWYHTRLIQSIAGSEESTKDD
jgi:hypothetical protein